MTDSMAKTAPQTDIEIVKEHVEKLLELMMTNASLEVSEGAEDSINVQITAEEDAGLLIGTHGKTIEALELISNLMLKNAKGDWRRVVVNISDWKEKEEKRLSDLAESVAHRVIETGKPQYLYNLSSAQRRTVHMLLAVNPDVVTASDGDGAERYLIVSPKQEGDLSTSE
jgi:spoIIIJ-associated protein